MEVLPVDLLEELLSKLDDDRIRVLYQKKELKKPIRKVFKRNIFWKKRVEWKLCQDKKFYEEIPVNSERWQWVYSIVAITFQGKLFEKVCMSNCIELAETLFLDSRFNGSYDVTSCFYNACQQGHSEIVKILLRDTRVNLFKVNLFSVIVIDSGWAIAIEKDQDKIVELILKDYRIDNLPPNFLKGKLLYDVLRQGCHPKVIRVLLADKRVNPSHASNSAFYSACVSGYVENVKAFLECERFVLNNDHSFILTAAAEKGCADVVELLLKDGRLDPGLESNMALWKSASNGHTATVKFLLADKRVDPSDQLNTVIIAALVCGYVDIVKLLLTDERIDVSEYSFESVVRNGNVEIVKILLDDGRVNPSFENNLLIRIATENGNDEIVQLLLADVRVSSTIDNNELVESSKSL